MLGFFLAFLEGDRATKNSSSKASHLLQSPGINRIPSKEGPEVRRIECMMIRLCILDVFDRLFVRSPLGVERIQNDHVQGSRCDQLSTRCGKVRDSRGGKMITRAARDSFSRRLRLSGGSCSTNIEFRGVRCWSRCHKWPCARIFQTVMAWPSTPDEFGKQIDGRFGFRVDVFLMCHDQMFLSFEFVKTSLRTTCCGGHHRSA